MDSIQKHRTENAIRWAKIKLLEKEYQRLTEQIRLLEADQESLMLELKDILDEMQKKGEERDLYAYNNKLGEFHPNFKG